MTTQLNWKNSDLALNNTENLSEVDDSSWKSYLIVIWLAGVMLFLPVKILNLPYNFELGDMWTLAGLPAMLYVYGLRRTHKISLTYAIPMWFVLISSFISAFASPAPSRSIIVILKEVYLFVWFFVLMAFFIQLSAKDLRRVLRVWSLVAVANGGLMIAQFLSPKIWEFTNALGGNSANLEGYRAAGLFICDAAGCANKAAFYQILGFVPLLLAGFSKRTTALLGVFLFLSILSTGSMGATLATTTGLIIIMFTIAYLKKSLWLLIKNFLRIIIALSIFGGMLYIIGSRNPVILNHFEKIIVGRFDKSSGGRFNLWSRGINVLLEHNSYLWGVGPENFRVVDAAQTDNQLHNDTLAFLVERGLIGLAGLALFAGIMLIKSGKIIKIYEKYPERAPIGVVIFLAVLGTTIVESLTHQVFHARELWLVLALQEAVLYKMITSESGIEPVIPVAEEPAQHRPELLAQPKFTLDR